VLPDVLQMKSDKATHWLLDRAGYRLDDKQELKRKSQFHSKMRLTAVEG